MEGHRRANVSDINRRFPVSALQADPEVLPTNERFVFSVRSRSQPGHRHRCDLLAEGGYGRCACRDFETRRWPAIKRGEPMGTRATLCWHLIAARRDMLNDLLKRLAEETERP